MPEPTPSRDRPTLAISIGDPGGIGPEVTLKSLADQARRAAARYRIYGSSAAMLDAARAAGIQPFWLRVNDEPSAILASASHPLVLVDSDSSGAPPQDRGPSPRSGGLSFQYVEAAIADTRRDATDPLRADAIVTAPISKEAWALAGHAEFPGHTELLASRFNAPRTAMMFESPRLRVVLVTAHIPLSHVCESLTIERVLDTIELGHDACRRLGVPIPRIAVCGVNPHAGEAGLLGDDEIHVIEPAMKLARARDIDVRGPFPGDTVFARALRGDVDLVVAMYHDQGLIPVKLLAFESAVNVTLGLPTVRTSPDHGTAFDIAGTNRADPGSMNAAIDLARRMCAPITP